MALSYLTGKGQASHVKLFEIRLVQSNIALRHGGDRTSSALLKGTLVLCLSEPLRVQKIVLRLIQQRKFVIPSELTRGHIKEDRKSWMKEWTFVDPINDPNMGNSQVLEAGNYEWPFELALDENIPTSVEGLPDCWVIYRLKAIIERQLLSSNFVAHKHLRIIKSFDPGSPELAQQTVQNIWPNKIAYAISTPTKAIIFGTSASVDFFLLPLRKGVSISNVKTTLFESRAITVYASNTTGHAVTHKVERMVLGDEFDFEPEDAESIDEDGQQGYRFQRQLQLPRKMGPCVQSVNAPGVHVQHKLVFTIKLLNPEGHTSEVRATIPIHIFISPSLPLNEENEVVDHPASAQSAHFLTHQAPPEYGQHSIDQIYSDVDPTGFVTPAVASGVNTPFNATSRNASVESLASMRLPTWNPISSDALESRLSNVNNSLTTTAASSPIGRSPPGATISRRGTASGSEGEIGFPSSSHDGSTTGEGTIGHRESYEAGVPLGVPVSQHLEYNLSDLSRVPSYKTALQSPAGTPVAGGLPTYGLATSRPPTPSPTTAQGASRAYTAGEASGAS